MPSLEGIRILVVDDDPDHLELLSYLVGQDGGTLRTAESGPEALELLRVWTPDVMVLDISMPDMDGFDLLQSIRGIDALRDLPAVAVTAHAYESDRQRCLKAGFKEHITKPYDPQELLALLATLAT